ncbi:11445_t:CDS:2, partial [Cetraspora pellucida]
MSERTQNQNRPQTQNRATPQAQPQVHANHVATPTQILPCSRDANHISVVDEQDDNVDEDEAFTAPAVHHQLYTTQRPSRYRKIAPMPTNEGSRPNQAPEIVPTMAPSRFTEYESQCFIGSNAAISQSKTQPGECDEKILSMDWFRQTGARLHADERKLYVQCQSKFMKIPMFYEGKILPAPLAIKEKPEKLKKPDDEDPFDDFEFNDENLDELDHESPAVYLSGVKSVPVEKTEGEESIIRKLKKNLNNEALMNDQKNHVSDILSKEVDVFAETVDDLGQTLAYVYEINTRNAFSIKQVPYHAAPSMHSFIKNEIEKLKAKGLVKEIYGHEATLPIHPCQEGETLEGTILQRTFDF